MKPLRLRPCLAVRAAQSGMSLIELMIGITLGLLLVAAASLLAVHHLDDSRRLLLETRVQQELRTAMDAMTRDLRRAGSSGSPTSAVWSPAHPLVTASAYTELSYGVPSRPLTDDVAPSDIAFSYTQDDNNTVDSPERAGFRLNGRAVDMLLGAGNYQQLTDPGVVTVTALSFRLRTQRIELGSHCALPCATTDPACPVQQVRTIDIAISARAVHDAAVQRSLVGRVRLPNDRVTGQCPVVPA